MALVLIKEDGTGRVDANAYADVAEADAYHEGHLYATTWTAATAEQKAIALVMASRLIDSLYQFGGVRTTSSQALQWPRYGCYDPDNVDGGLCLPAVSYRFRTPVGPRFVADNVVPPGIRNATCEMARELIVADRTAPPPGEGLKYQNVGSTQTGYDKEDTRPVIQKIAQAMLAKYGSLLSAKSGAVRLLRT
jgi:hypothetical protein